MNSVIDIVILIVLGLSLIWGFISGFSKKRLSSFASQCGIIVAYFAGGPLVSLLGKTDLLVYLQKGFASVLPSSDAFNATIASDVTTRNNQMSTALSEIHIVKVFQSIFTSNATDFTNDVKDAIASSFSNWILIVAVYLVLFLAIFFLVKILLTPLWKDNSLFGEKGKSFFGRICGMVRMVFKSTLMILIVMVILSLVSSLCAKYGNTTLQDWINNDLNMTDTSFSIGKLFYNTSNSIFGWISTNAGA